MAYEMKRGCGYRKVGGLYLVGEYISISCDRLPYLLDVCPVCGAGIKVGRGMTKINPLQLFGEHKIKRTVEVIPGGFERPPQYEEIEERCSCHSPCILCDPTEEPAYIMGVGERHYPTPEDFIQEGITQGFSKRIAQIPKEFDIGKTIIYLAHPKACEVKTPVAMQQALNILEGKDIKQPALLDAEKNEKAMGIFTAFIPQRIEKLYWQSEIDTMADKEKEALTKRGITPIGIPNGDSDHQGE